MKRSAMKRSQPRRDWSEARSKVEREGRCRVCGDVGTAIAYLEAAHVIGREHDNKAIGFGPKEDRSMLWVSPLRIVPLCRHMQGGCHPKYDAHELDLLPYLTVEEQAQAVLDAGSIELARNRICGRAT